LRNLLRTVKRAQAYDGQALKASTPEKAAKSHERAQEAYRESISAFVDAVTAQPTMYKSWYYIGLADLRLGNYDEALSAYAKVLELKPHHPDAIENRGEVFLALNQIEEAQWVDGRTAIARTAFAAENVSLRPEH
jgi:cytochrome c-type biogenesis protein CcmH/NrfG